MRPDLEGIMLEDSDPDLGFLMDLEFAAPSQKSMNAIQSSEYALSGATPRYGFFSVAAIPSLATIAGVAIAAALFSKAAICTNACFDL